MYLRLAIATVISLVILGGVWKAFTVGRDTVQRKWDAERAAQAVAQAEADRRQQTVAESVANQVAQAQRRDRIVYRTLIKEAAHVQSDCPVPADFRLLHDAAAAATEMPDSGAARTDAAPAELKVVAETVVENYEICVDTARRLEALQQIIRAYNED